MNKVRIISARKALPRYARTTEEIMPSLMEWLRDEDRRKQRKAEKIFQGAGVRRRFGIMDIADVFTQTSFEEKNREYASAAVELGERALRTALNDSNWDPNSIDIIISVSCTGIMIPSLDAYLVNRVGLPQDIIRLPVTEMGCAAGISGLIYARRFLQAHPGSRAAVVAVECPSATFQHTDRSMANIVSAALFGDGASCVLLSSEEEARGTEILTDGMYHFPKATDLMGFDLTNHGLKMILSPDVPQTITDHFEALLNPFLEQAGTRQDELKHLIFHPGGRKIIEATDAVFKEGPANLDKTAYVLQEYGNMSSATVLYVLEEFLRDPDAQPGLGLMLSFGPGFTAQRILIDLVPETIQNQV
ncbi:Predicted naringenin-chalcone synthase [Robiginitalea myxolifaciens]|uniref:Predicted naringenin-chalcone synthase n=1 Tax=Robiginitalea myxolifaciens TaxID=400055 RepID=A0A1I6GYW9_9FLAO|nr:type III polyketide synthase [Robiginitalea myxolifaciens]SFR47319.1 Predicted naringenin-chalcone synthase [Robiginitalea myxolifaciens]